MKNQDTQISGTISQIASLIQNFEKNVEFSSHDVIENYIENFESDYIQMLIKHQNSGRAFQNVNSFLAREMSLNSDILGLTKTEKKISENVRGNLDLIHWWIIK